MKAKKAFLFIFFACFRGLGERSKVGLLLGGRGGEVAAAVGQRGPADDSTESVRHLQRMAVVQRLRPVACAGRAHIDSPQAVAGVGNR